EGGDHLDQAVTALDPAPSHGTSARDSLTSPVSQATSMSQAAPSRTKRIRPPVEAPSGKNITAPSPSEACAWRAPMKRISSSGGNSPARPSAPLQACAAGSSVKRCGVPVAIARTLAWRNWEATSLDACRNCTPASPPVKAAAAITPMAAISATTTSISTSETPRWRRCLLVADVGIRAAATRLAVTAQHHQLEGGVLARRLVQHRVAP